MRHRPVIGVTAAALTACGLAAHAASAQVTATPPASAATPETAPVPEQAGAEAPVAGMTAAPVLLPTEPPKLEFVHRFTWHLAQDGANSFSGLAVLDGGARIVTVTDKGRIATGIIVRREGRIVGLADIHILPLLDRKGRPVRRFDVDAEGLAIGAGGRLYVSFEGRHRVWEYAAPTAPARALPGHEDFRHFQTNSGMEALAIDPEGRLYTLPERSGEWERPFPLYRFEDGRWTHLLDIPRRGRHLPAGADFGPDGWFYLLERDFVWYKGFSTRIRRFRFRDGRVVAEQELLRTPFGLHDNLEGLSAWRDESGATVLTMISDDNGNILQRTELVEYRVHEAVQEGAASAGAASGGFAPAAPAGRRSGGASAETGKTATGTGG